MKDMKIRNFIVALSVAFFAIGCAEESIAPSYDSLSVSENFIKIPADGGEVKFTINASKDWSIYEQLLPICDDKGDTTWKLEVTPKSGKAGSHTITVKSDTTTATRSAELCIVIGDRTEIDAAYKALTDLQAEQEDALSTCLDKASEDAVKKQFKSKISAAEAALNAALVSAERQYVTIKQSMGAVEVKYSTCQEIIDGPDGPVYYAKGTVTKISNTQYGNWYLKDAEGKEVYIYGTLDANGQTKNFESLGLAEGDEVTLSGPKTTYNGTVELVDVTILSINKAFIKLEKTSVEVKKEAGSTQAVLTLMDDAKWTAETSADWLTITTTHTSKGNTVVSIDYAEYNEKKAPRSATVVFKASRKSGETVKEAELNFTVKQFGIMPEPIAVAEVVKKAKNEWVAVEGLVTGVNGDGNVITDAAGNSIFAYKATAKLGQKVVVTGSLSSYRKFFQISNPIVEVKSSDNKVEYGTPAALTEAMIKAIADGGDTTTTYFTYTGQAGDAAAYGTITVGAYTLSPYKVDSSIKYDRAYGKKVKVEGYFYQLNNKDMRYTLTKVQFAE